MSSDAHFTTPGGIDAAAAKWIARRDAGLTEDEASEFEQWRASDPQHAQALARFDATWSALGRPRRTGASSMLAGELRALKRRNRFRRAGMLGGTLIVAAFAGLSWRPLRIAPGSETPAESTQAALLLPESRTLPDGSVVEFPAGSEIIVEFSERIRRVALKRGEAHFVISKDAGRPFVVDAAGVEVRAVGTAFAVQMRHAAIEVLVTEGRVEVSSEFNADPMNERTKNAPDGALTGGTPAPLLRGRPAAIPVDSGNRVVLDLTSPTASRQPPPVVKVPESEIAERLAWRSPRVEFSGAPLPEVLALLNRCNTVQFIIDDPSLESVTLSGLFRAEDTDAFIRMLETGFGVQADRRGNEIFLRKLP